MRIVSRALLDPLAQRLALLRRKRAVGIQRRHHVIRVRGEDAHDQFALLGLAGNDRAFAQRDFAVIEAQLGFALVRVRAVAMKAVLRKDRANVAIEVDALGRAGCVRAKSQRERTKQEHQANERPHGCGNFSTE